MFIRRSKKKGKEKGTDRQKNKLSALGCSVLNGGARVSDVPVFVGSDGELTEANFELKERKAREVSERERRERERE